MFLIVPFGLDVVISLAGRSPPSPSTPLSIRCASGACLRHRSTHVSAQAGASWRRPSTRRRSSSSNAWALSRAIPKMGHGAAGNAPRLSRAGVSDSRIRHGVVCSRAGAAGCSSFAGRSSDRVPGFAAQFALASGILNWAIGGVKFPHSARRCGDFILYVCFAQAVAGGGAPP